MHSKAFKINLCLKWLVYLSKSKSLPFFFQSPTSLGTNQSLFAKDVDPAGPVFSGEHRVPHTPSHHIALAQIQHGIHTSMACHHQHKGERNIWHLATQRDKGPLNQEVWSTLPTADKPMSLASCRKAALQVSSKSKPLSEHLLREVSAWLQGTCNQ